MPTAQLLSFMSDSSAQTPFITELGSGKISKAGSPVLIPSLVWLSQLPEVMWVSALHGCVINVSLLGTQCMSLLALGPHAQQKEDRDQMKIVHKPMSFISLIVSAPLD